MLEEREIERLRDVRNIWDNNDAYDGRKRRGQALRFFPVLAKNLPW